MLISFKFAFKKGEVDKMEKQMMVKKRRKIEKGEMVPLTYDEATKIMFSNPDRLEPLALLLSRFFEERYEDILGRIKL